MTKFAPDYATRKGGTSSLISITHYQPVHKIKVPYFASKPIEKVQEEVMSVLKRVLLMTTDSDEDDRQQPQP